MVDSIRPMQLVGESATNEGPYSATNVAIDPITLVIRDCITISSKMRKRSSQNGNGVAAILGGGDVFGDEESIASRFGIKHNSNKTNDPLLGAFVQLRVMLMEIRSLDEIDLLTLIQPFLLTIKSSETSGYITGLALDAISRFISYGIISWKSSNLQVALAEIITSLTHCRFEAAEQTSDDSVLLKVLYILDKIVQSPLLELIPNENISELLKVNLMLTTNKHRNEILRKSAEQTLMNITIRLFSSISKFNEEEDLDYMIQYSNEKVESMSTGDDEDDKIYKDKTVEIHGHHHSNGSDEKVSANNSQPKPKHPKLENKQEDSFGILAIYEFLSTLSNMISPENQYKNLESTKRFILQLLNTAIEVSGHELKHHESLMSLISDPICKHILQIIQTVDNPILLQDAINLFLTITVTLDLKAQVELGLSLIYKAILPVELENKNVKSNGKSKEPILSLRNASSKEMLIESISLLWTRSPQFFVDLYLQFDCDFERKDIAQQTLDFLCELALPESASVTSDNVPPICLEGLFSFINACNDRVKQAVSRNIEFENLASNDLIEQKNKKVEFLKCIEEFNRKPKNGIKLLKEKKFIEDDLESLASFLFHKSSSINKKVIGEFVGGPDNIELLNIYFGLFNFEDVRVDEALRLLLKAFRLPGESQQIYRIIECFADRYVSCQKFSEKEDDPEQEQVVLTADSTLFLSYSIIMLNTDLHSPQIKQHMTLASFQSQIRGQNDKKDFPTWWSEKIYNSIRDREIIMPEEHHDKFFDDVWNNLITNNDVSQNEENDLKLASSYITDELSYLIFDKSIFEACSSGVIETLVKIFKAASDDNIVTSLISTINKISNIAIFFKLDSTLDLLTSSLVELSTLSGKKVEKNIEGRQAIEDGSSRDEIPLTQIHVKDNEQLITISELSFWFGRNFKAQLSTVVLFRIIKKNNYYVTSSSSWDKVIRIILNLFENCLYDSNIFPSFQRKLYLLPLPQVKPQYVINRSKPLKENGLLSTFSSFLKGYSDEPPEPTDQEVEATMSTIDCINSTNITDIFGAISQSSCQQIREFILLLINEFPSYSKETERYFEPESLFIVETIAFLSLISDTAELSNEVITKLDGLADLKEHLSEEGKLRFSTYKLLLLRSGDSTGSEALTKEISDLAKGFQKESITKLGKQLIQPIKGLVDENSWCCKQLFSNSDYWTILRNFASIPAFTPEIYEFIEGVVKTAPGEINVHNYMSLLGLLDEISSIGAIGAQWEQEYDELVRTGHKVDKEQSSVYKEIVEVSKKSINLTGSLTSIISKEAFKDMELSSYTIIQALAHQCFNPCREIRGFAVKSLQLAVLSIRVDENLTPEGIFELGLFPLLSEILKPEVLSTDPHGFGKTQLDLLSLVSKVFLQFIHNMKPEKINKIWFEILDYSDKLIVNETNSNNKDKMLKEAGIELIKNIILILKSSDILIETNKELWDETWLKVDQLYPGLREEIEGNKEETQTQEVEEVQEIEGKGEVEETKEVKGTEESPESEEVVIGTDESDILPDKESEVE